MNILLVGNGSREHAVAKAIKRSRHHTKLFTYGGATNPEILKLSEEYYTGDMKDIDAMVEFAITNKVEFAFIGPENPIAEGVTDKLKEKNIPSVAPSQSLARLESSKGFTRNLLKKYNIEGNPKFKNFEGTGQENEEKIKTFLSEIGENFVVKYDSLYGGKGVKVSGEHLHSQEEGLEYAKECLNKCGKVVIEEKLIGQEFSLISIVDGKTVLDCPVIQDHKRAYSGDTGPNTGGMGTYSDSNHSLPFLIQKNIDDAHKINVDVMKTIEKECGEKYKGIMYGGFIVTKNGVKLIEYNIRFGDPEAMNILPIMKTDFVDLCLAVINENLKDISLDFEKVATVCKYVVPKGYPDNPLKGEKIEINKIPENCEVFYGSVEKTGDELIMCGSRALAFVGKGKNLEEAEIFAQKGVESVKGKVFFREDIGTKELIQKRIDHMDIIRR